MKKDRVENFPALDTTVSLYLHIPSIIVKRDDPILHQHSPTPLTRTRVWICGRVYDLTHTRGLIPCLEFSASFFNYRHHEEYLRFQEFKRERSIRFYDCTVPLEHEDRVK